ncbi:MAG: guanylate kinase [Planctomycetota bacterium]
MDGEGLILIVSGPSGVGKTTIARSIEQTIPQAVFSVSATTRQPRAQETAGESYYFLPEEQFLDKVGAGAFLEHAEYAGNRYGTLREPTDELLAKGRVVLLDIEVEGAKQVKARMPSALAIFIEAPSDEELLRRLRDRRSEDERTIMRRFDVARREITEAHACGVYDVFIVNDDLERATAEAIEIVRSRM